MMHFGRLILGLTLHCYSSVTEGRTHNDTKRKMCTRSRNYQHMSCFTGLLNTDYIAHMKRLKHTSAFSSPLSLFLFSVSLAFSARLFNMWLVGRHATSVGTAVRHCGHWGCVLRTAVIHPLQKECPQRRVTGSVKIVRQTGQVKSSE